VRRLSGLRSSRPGRRDLVPIPRSNLPRRAWRRPAPTNKRGNGGTRMDGVFERRGRKDRLRRDRQWAAGGVVTRHRRPPTGLPVSRSHAGPGRLPGWPTRTSAGTASPPRAGRLSPAPTRPRPARADRPPGRPCGHRRALHIGRGGHWCDHSAARSCPPRARIWRTLAPAGNPGGSTSAALITGQIPLILMNRTAVARYETMTCPTRSPRSQNGALHGEPYATAALGAKQPFDRDGNER
jgi:hypothetical protein